MKEKCKYKTTIYVVLATLVALFGLVFQVNAKAADAGSMREGATIRASNTSPTGYTVTFVYKNATAKSVKLVENFSFAYPGNNYPANSVVTYSPEQWEKGMFPISSYPSVVKDMTKVDKTDYWTINMPLPSGGYPYSYNVDGKVIADPANIPMMNENGGTQSLSMVYVPFDGTKQVLDYSYVLPKLGAKKGTVSFAKYSTNGLLSADQYLGVYLPYGYDAKRSEPYKVIYLSHGGGGNEADWYNTGSASNIMDNLISSNQTEPAIVVTMNNSAFANDKGWDLVKITDNLMKNILPYVESHYNVSKNAKDRAFAGLSMGALTSSSIYYSNAADFGYFGIFSGAKADEDLSKHDINVLKAPVLFVGAGCYDMAYFNLGFNATMYTEKLLDNLEKYSIPYYIDMVGGSHDWFTWPQLFYKFAKDIVWK